ncbi:PD-(D/E)XK nuclease family transposase [Lachnoclostridium sp. An76]|uniref:PD-(D/E)XK nuclease family transposase n=1 Tax=Lachnoclostridium sp. An76 TaxID=1965654 RepID=UPI001179FB10|nr:PD-(D/E)XK nuclease family transposase [Lachnoclostridium sp. An76]
MTNKKKETKEPLITGTSPPGSAGLFAERERRLKDLEQLTLLSDVFMSVVLSDRNACQHVIRILMDDPGIELVSVRTQYVISKVISHGARLDVLAEDKKGVICHLEIEGADVADHARRTRFYGSVTDGEFLRKGRDYNELPERYIFYISRKDIWKDGYTVYEEEKRFRQTGKKHNDGSHLIYVNAEIDDGSRIAKLMKYFKTADPFDDSEGELSKRVRFLKTEEGGIEIMCEIMERIREEGRESGMKESHKKTAWNLEKMGMPLDTIAKVVEEDVSVVRQWLKSAK